MKLTESLFAYGSLSSHEKFITALRITAKRFSRGNVQLAGVLYAIMSDYEGENRYRYDQVQAMTGTSFSKELAMEMKKFFVMVLEDDELIVDYLNKEISNKYWRREKAAMKSEDETQAIVDVLIKTNLGAFLTD